MGDGAGRLAQRPRPSADTRAAGNALPWAAILGWALLGTVLGSVLVLANLRTSASTTGGLVHTGPSGPAAALIARDLPEEPQFTYGESDGPMFYAIARDMWDLDRAAQSLDRPRYRLNRPGYPFLAWLLHPTGGGRGLVASMLAVNVAAMAVAAVSVGVVVATMGGPVWPAVLLPLLPGAQMATRISCADLLAVALMAAATALFLRERWAWATAVAVAAALTKEPVILTFVGLALWRRDRRGLAFAAVPAAAFVGWALFIRIRFADSGQDVIELGPPLVGVADSIRYLWSRGDDVYALVAVAALAVLVVAGLARHRFGHPLVPALLLNLVLLSLLSITPIGLTRNGPRSVLPALLLAVAVAATPPARDDLVTVRAAAAATTT